MNDLVRACLIITGYWLAFGGVLVIMAYLTDSDNK